MSVQQLVVVEQARLRPSVSAQEVALFGPDGSPLILNESKEETGDFASSKELSVLKGRVTKLENKVKEWEGEES